MKIKCFIFHFLLIASINISFSQNPDYIEETVLCKLVNSIDSFPIGNFAFFNQQMDSKIYYRLWLDIDTNKTIEIIKGYPWDKFNIFESEPGTRKGEVSPEIFYNNSSCYKKIKKINSYNKFKRTSKKGDLYFLILRAWKYMEKNYVIIVLEGNGTILETMFLFKLNMKSEIERVFVSVAEK